MSIVLSNRRTVRSSSPVVLNQRVIYISDPNHPDHSGEKEKMIHPAKNYHVPGSDQSPEAFVREVLRIDKSYHDCRFGKKGKRSPRLYEEIIYSTEEGAWLTKEERDEIERRIVARFGAIAVCRTAWHVGEKNGRCDMHLLLSAKNLDYPPGMTLWAEFGGSNCDHIYAAMDRLDVEITRYLNRTPERQKAKLKSAKRRHRDVTAKVIGRQAPLAEELAKYFLSQKKKLTEVNETDIVAAIESFGHEIVLPIGRTVAVRFRGRKKIRKYNLASLQDETVIAVEMRLPSSGYPSRESAPSLLRADNPAI